MSNIEFTISVPTDEGFLGRECNALKCRRYFKVHVDCIRPKMYCPYCGWRFRNDKLHTKDQVEHFEEAGMEQALEYAHGEIDKMFGKLAKEFKGNDIIQLDYKPTRYRAKRVVPKYRERKVDTELTCPECSFRFQVLGLFGLCPGCRAENMAIYEANLAIIRKEVQASENTRRSLRHAYSDLVSTFEQFCAKKAPSHAKNTPSFQDLFATRKFFKKSISIDILGGLSDAELLTLRRVFQKRHACQHCGGKITDQYTKKVPEDAKLLGADVELSLEEFNEGARVLRHVVDRIVTAGRRKLR